MEKLLFNPKILAGYCENLAIQAQAVFIDQNEQSRQQRLLNRILDMSGSRERWKLYVFGSRSTGLSLADSDIDVFADVGECQFTDI